MTVPFSVEVDRLDDHVLLSVAGDVDLSTAAQVRDAGLEAVGVEPSSIVIDLSAVTFIDSTGLGVLVLLRRKARARRSVLRVVSTRRTNAILKISGLEQAFDLYPDLASALGEVGDIA